MDVLAAAKYCDALNRKVHAPARRFDQRLGELSKSKEVAQAGRDSDEALANAGIIRGKCKD